ncbi:MAG: alpha/beta fold hydrolase, partial [Solirubrobacterales bacterium]|nr:alpha/beta fold hydrolase [Solirubrobacterales bacterium]
MASTLAVDHDQAGPYGAVGRSAWLDVDWSAHLRWLTVAGRPVNVCDLGPTDGEAIVWIHGLSGCWQNWLENVPALADAGYRCVALDLPGFGCSPMPAERITIARYADLIDELLKALGIQAACVVGNSMGGFAAAELAIAHPQRVERLVLISAAGIAIEHDRIGDRIGALRRAEFAINAYGGWLASRSDRVARRARLRQAAFRVVAAHPDQLPAALVAENLRASGTPGFLDALEALTSYP